jgi:hypothetical protein
MRRLVTLALIIVFVAGFCGFFAMQSLILYARDADAMIATARAARLRQASVDLATEVIYEELRRSPHLANVPRPQITLVVGQVITDRWVEETVRGTHHSVMTAVQGAGDTAVLDLGPTKASLAKAFALLGARARAECAAILGPKPCVSSAKAKVAMAAYLASVQVAIQRIPERIELLAAIEASGQAERLDAFVNMDSVRGRLRDFGKLRWLGLAVLGAGLVLIALLNWRPPGRTLQATGAALASAAVTYLVVSRLVAWLGPGLLAGQVARVRVQQPDESAAVTIVIEGLQRMLAELVVGALGVARPAVIACALAGALLLVASRFFPRDAAPT